MLDRKAHDVLPGFSAASKSDYQLERYSHDTNSFTQSNTCSELVLRLYHENETSLECFVCAPKGMTY